MKVAGQTRTQFGVRVAASSKVGRSLFPGTIQRKIVSQTTHTPDRTVLGSTSEVTKHWDTTSILEREAENNSDIFQLTTPVSPAKASESGARDQSRETKVTDIFDQCLRQYRRKRPETRQGQRDSQPRSNKKKRT